jgi:hypothetical protein
MLTTQQKQVEDCKKFLQKIEQEELKKIEKRISEKDFISSANRRLDVLEDKLEKISSTKELREEENKKLIIINDENILGKETLFIIMNFLADNYPLSYYINFRVCKSLCNLSNKVFFLHHHKQGTEIIYLNNFNDNGNRRCISLGIFEYIMECLHFNKLDEINRFLDINPVFLFKKKNIDMSEDNVKSMIKKVLDEQTSMIKALIGTHNRYNSTLSTSDTGLYYTHQVINNSCVITPERQHLLIRLLELIPKIMHKQLNDYFQIFHNTHGDDLTNEIYIDNVVDCLDKDIFMFKNYVESETPMESLLLSYVFTVIKYSIDRGCEIIYEYFVNKYNLLQFDNFLHNVKVIVKKMLNGSYYNYDVDRFLRYAFENDLSKVGIKRSSEISQEKQEIQLEQFSNHLKYNREIQTMFDIGKVYFRKIKLFHDYQLCDVESMNIIDTSSYFLSIFNTDVQSMKYKVQTIETMIKCHYGRKILQTQGYILGYRENCSDTVIDIDDDLSKLKLRQQMKKEGILSKELDIEEGKPNDKELDIDDDLSKLKLRQQMKKEGNLSKELDIDDDLSKLKLRQQMKKEGNLSKELDIDDDLSKLKLRQQIKKEGNLNKELDIEEGKTNGKEYDIDVEKYRSKTLNEYQTYLENVRRLSEDTYEKLSKYITKCMNLPIKLESLKVYCMTMNYEAIKTYNFFKEDISTHELMKHGSVIIYSLDKMIKDISEEFTDSLNYPLIMPVIKKKKGKQILSNVMTIIDVDKYISEMKLNKKKLPKEYKKDIHELYVKACSILLFFYYDDKKQYLSLNVQLIQTLIKNNYLNIFIFLHKVGRVMFHSFIELNKIQLINDILENNNLKFFEYMTHNLRIDITNKHKKMISSCSKEIIEYSVMHHLL